MKLVIILIFSLCCINAVVSESSNECQHPDFKTPKEIIGLLSNNMMALSKVLESKEGDSQIYFCLDNNHTSCNLVHSSILNLSGICIVSIFTILQRDDVPIFTLFTDSYLEWLTTFNETIFLDYLHDIIYAFNKYYDGPDDRYGWISFIERRT